MKNEVIYALIVDDDYEFAESFQRQAIRENIKISHKNNYKDMVQILPSIKDKIATIILDIKCLKESEQKIENKDFLLLALKHLYEKYSYIPRAILTADPDAYNEFKEILSEEKLFRKTSEEREKLLNYIKEQSANLEIIKLRHTYADVFKIFEKSYLPEESEKDFLRLLQTMQNDDLTEIKKNLALIRTILEKVFQTLNEKDENIIPNHCFNRNNIRFREIHEHLKSRDTYCYTNIIEYFSQAIYRISSDQGSHSPDETDYKATKYTAQSLTFALMDLLKWFEARMDNITNS